MNANLAEHPLLTALTALRAWLGAGLVARRRLMAVVMLGCMALMLSARVASSAWCFALQTPEVEEEACCSRHAAAAPDGEERESPSDCPLICCEDELAGLAGAGVPIPAATQVANPGASAMLVSHDAPAAAAIVRAGHASNPPPLRSGPPLYLRNLVILC